MRNSIRVGYQAVVPERRRWAARALWALPPALLALSSPALAGGPYFTKGTYVGRVTCKRDSGLGSVFDARWRFSGWDVEVSYEDTGYASEEPPRALRTVDRGYGFFDVYPGSGLVDVSIAGRPAGEGYCARRLCHLELLVDGLYEEWNLLFRYEPEEQLLVARSMRDADGLRVCEEELVLQPPPAPGS